MWTATLVLVVVLPRVFPRVLESRGAAVSAHPSGLSLFAQGAPDCLWPPPAGDCPTALPGPAPYCCQTQAPLGPSWTCFRMCGGERRCTQVLGRQRARVVSRPSVGSVGLVGPLLQQCWTRGAAAGESWRAGPGHWARGLRPHAQLCSLCREKRPPCSGGAAVNQFNSRLLVWF